jgi:hypothetical protein
MAEKRRNKPGVKKQTVPPPPPPPDDDDNEDVNTDTGEITEHRELEVVRVSGFDEPDDDIEVSDLMRGDFAGMWERDKDGYIPECLMLYRINPDRSWTYLENLPPGRLEYLSHIQANYGGGLYRCQAKRRNERGQPVVYHAEDNKIEGAPRTPDSDRRDKPAEITGTAPQPAPPVKTNITIHREGLDIPLDIELDQVEKLAMRLAAIRAAFPMEQKPTDINTELLLALLKERRESASLDFPKLLESVGATLGTLREMMPEGSNNGNSGDAGGWLGLAGQIVDAVKTLAQARVPIHRVVTHPPTKEIAAPATTTYPAAPMAPGKEIPEDTTISQNNQNMEAEPMNMKTAAALAIDKIVSAFSTVPHKEPVDVVQMLDVTLELDKEQRAKLQPYRTLFFNEADLALNKVAREFDEFDTTDFDLFFYRVFDMYVDPNREMTTLAGGL